ncbi:meiosis protein 5 [Monosporozyma servazzii]
MELDNTTLVDFELNEIVQSTPRKCCKVEKKPFKNPSKRRQKLNFAQCKYDIKEDKEYILSTNSIKPHLKKGLTINDRELREAIKILTNYDKEIKTKKLIEKWRSITQAAMSYILNMTLCKIDKIGGYEELRKKELKMQKKRLEYMMDDSMQDEMDNILESDEFNQLPIDDQEEYRRMMEEKLKDFENHKQKELKKLEEELTKTTNKEMDMLELSKRLNVSYSLVFPSENIQSPDDFE